MIEVMSPSPMNRTDVILGTNHPARPVLPPILTSFSRCHAKLGWTAFSQKSTAPTRPRCRPIRLNRYSRRRVVPISLIHALRWPPGRSTLGLVQLCDYPAFCDCPFSTSPEMKSYSSPLSSISFTLVVPSLKIRPGEASGWRESGGWQSLRSRYAAPSAEHVLRRVPHYGDASIFFPQPDPYEMQSSVQGPGTHGAMRV